MAIQDHVAILLSGSLDRPAANKKKPHAAPRYYVRLAMPPEAGADLGAAMAQVAPGGNWQATSHNIRPNSQVKNPYPGIPADWLIIKLDTQFPVPVYGEDSRLIPASAENSALIRTQFYSGQKVRVEGAPYTWLNDGEQGISWNLYGVLAVGGGERRGGGDGFSQYRNTSQPAVGAFGSNAPAQQPAPQETLGATSTHTGGSNTTSGGNPFQQSNAGASGSPFG